VLVIYKFLLLGCIQPLQGWLFGHDVIVISIVCLFVIILHSAACSHGICSFCLCFLGCEQIQVYSNRLEILGL